MHAFFVNQGRAQLYNVKTRAVQSWPDYSDYSCRNKVPVYNLLRTICDIIRSRNKVGTETFLAALRLYAASPKKDLNKLHSYAKRCVWQMSCGAVYSIPAPEIFTIHTY